MSKISKTTAEEVAKKALAKYSNEIDEQKKIIKQLATNLYLKHVGNEVLSAFKSFDPWFKKTSQIQLVGNGFNHQVFKIDGYLPTNNSNGSNHFISINSDDKELIDLSNQLLKATRSENDLQKKYDVLLEQLIQALLALSSYKRIIENLPQVAPFLPVQKKMEIIVDLSDIKKFI